MMAQEAEDLTGFSSRFIPADDDHAWLSCQIGKWQTVLVKTSKVKTVPQMVFHLKYYGSSWELAYKMFLKR